MGWFILAVVVIAFAYLVRRRVRRIRRSGPDWRAIGSDQMSSRVAGNMVTGKDVNYRRY